MTAVSDSSPIIGLNAIGRLDPVRAAFSTVFIPPAVAREIKTFPLPDWLKVTNLRGETPKPELSLALGAGETETLILAAQLRPDFVILDDEAARIAAVALGFNIIGVVAILLNAKKMDLLPLVRHELDALKAASFHISPRLYRHILARAGETDAQ